MTSPEQRSAATLVAHTDAMRNLFVLTGHTRGLGAALLEQLAADPANHVFALGRHVTDRRGPTVTQLPVDLAFADDAVGALDTALASFDWSSIAVAHLVNNAGVLAPIRQVGSLGVSETAFAINVNLTAPMVLTDAFVRLTAGRDVERRIIHISSGAARSPYAGWATYCAAKAGLDHFARVLALEAPPRCRVASVAPGVIDTDMQAEIRASNANDFPSHDRFVGLARDGLLASPTGVAARVIAYLTSDAFGEATVVDLRELAS